MYKDYAIKYWLLICVCVFVFVCFTDFQEVLKLEPGNKQALNELQKLQIVSLMIQLLVKVNKW